MVKEWRHAGVACLMVALAACSAQPAKEAPPAFEPDADMQEVTSGLKMIQSGQIQAAIDGPLTDVIDRLDKKYAGSHERIYSARGPVQSLIYLLGEQADQSKSTTPAPRRDAIALGAAWGMAYWARGYAYSEMARYPEAEADLTKALSLSPKDAQYTGELAYVYQMQKRWNESLALYTAMPDMVWTMDGWDDGMKKQIQCKALRGQGYDLVELKRYDEAKAAYKACLKVIPGEPKSTAELGYIDTLRRKGG